MHERRTVLSAGPEEGKVLDLPQHGDPQLPWSCFMNLTPLGLVTAGVSHTRVAYCPAVGPTTTRFWAGWVSPPPG